MSDTKCMACEDTGRNSRGTLCYACYTNGRQFVRDAVVSAVQELFAEKWARQRLPTEEEVVAATKRSFAPPIMYAIGFRSGVEMGMFAGPVLCYTALLDIVPPEDPYGRTAYIIKMKIIGNEPVIKPIMSPIAKWHNGAWRFKKNII